MRTWLAYTPRIPAELRSQVRASAEARYQKFMERVAEGFTGGKRFIDDLPQEQIADPDELEIIARRASEELTAASPPRPHSFADDDGSKPRDNR